MGDPKQPLSAAAPADLARRQFLRKAAVAGTAAWTVPTIITMQPAGASELTSPPPEPPVDPPEPPVQPPPEVDGAAVPRPPVEVQGVTQSPASRVAGLTELPRTGAELDHIAAAGLAATAGGAALVLWGADAEK